MKRVLIFCFSLAALITACKKESPTSPTLPPTKNPPVINSFSVSPTNINFGDSATLSWGVSNGTSISIDQGIGSVSASGSREVSPLDTTTYILTAINNDGQATKSCTLTIKKVANVVMTAGPIFEDGYSLFEYKGIIKNVGNADAEWIKIYIYIHKSNNDLITFEYTYADDYMLAPNETSPWNVLFMDSNHSIRNQMDKSKTTYEIKWD